MEGNFLLTSFFACFKSESLLVGEVCGKLFWGVREEQDMGFSEVVGGGVA